MSVLHVIGIDPGLVHTGCVRVVLEAQRRRIVVQHLAVPGIDADEVVNWVGIYRREWPKPQIYIEKYEPRLKLNSDERMVKGEAELKRRIPSARLLSNTGIRQVVTKDLMQALELWVFPQTTHHQDLRAAARIALLGAMKDPVANRVLADATRDLIDGRAWIHD